MQHIKKEMEDFETIISQDKPTLVDFFTESCNPCDMLTPILRHVKENLGNRVKVLQINLDKHPEFAKVFDVHSAPTMLLFQDGQVKWRTSYVLSNSEIVSAIIKNMD